jgi:ribose transport system ATP-binding protein
MTGTLLSVENVTKSYAGNRVLDDVSVRLGKNEVVGLIGENGAGKSTLLKMLAGIVQPDSGRLVLRGRVVSLRDVSVAAAEGICMVFQEQSLLTNVSVSENILIGQEHNAIKYGFYDWSKLHALAEQQLARLGIDIDPRVETGKLSFAQRQLVEMTKALAIQDRTEFDPIILLDEPTSVLQGEELEMVLQYVEKLKQQATVVFVSHRLDEVIRVSDRVYVMTNGRCVAERETANCNVDELQRLMLGHELTKAYSATQAPEIKRGRATTRLRVERLTAKGRFNNVTIDLRAGEVLGIAGVEGSGREALCRSIFGAEPVSSGVIFIDGREVQLRNCAQAVSIGMGYLPSERRVEGVLPGLSVRENITLAFPERVMSGPFFSGKKERNLVDQWIARLRIKTPSAETQVSRLSGGNQQKVSIAKWLIADKLKVLIVDHPMRGLDVGAKAEIFTLIRELSAEGLGIILIADTLEELLALSHRIIVMRDGEVTAEYSCADKVPTQLQILENMV